MYIESATSELRIVGHRGAAALAPENSLEAFHEAALAGANAIEADARLSRDGHVVLVHDERLERTTGYRGAVGDLSADELEPLGVPRLHTLLSGFPKTLDCCVDGCCVDLEWYIDMKEPGLALAGAVAGVASRTGMGRRVWLTGPDRRQLQHGRDLEPGLRLSWTIGAQYGTLASAALVEAALLGVDEIAVTARELSGSLLGLARSLGLDVRAFGIQSAQEARTLIELGCATLTLDDPRRDSLIVPQPLAVS